MSLSSSYNLSAANSCTLLMHIKKAAKSGLFETSICNVYL